MSVPVATPGASPSPRPIGLAPGAPAQAAGQDAAKYGSTNPVVRRLLDRWSARLREVVGPIQGTVVDVGIGEGLCLERLVGTTSPPLTSPLPADTRPADAEASGPAAPSQPIPPPSGADARVLGIEYRFDKAQAAARRLSGVAAVVGDAGMLPVPDGRADLVTCIEVLEHLPAVDRAVAELARVTAGRCVVSVPWEPWFRLGNLGRGKNVGRLGNDPEHVGWFTPRRLRRTLEREFAEVRIVRAFPWIVAEARGPRRP